MTWCSNKNTDKVVEMVESLSNQETKYGGSQLFVPGKFVFDSYCIPVVHV